MHSGKVEFILPAAYRRPSSLLTFKEFAGSPFTRRSHLQTISKFLCYHCLRCMRCQ